MEGVLIIVGLVVGLCLGAAIAESGTVAAFDATACDLACARNGAGKRHASDETWCTCTSGVALKRDRSRLYVRITPTLDASAKGKGSK